MKINVGDIVEFRSSTGVKRGEVKRKDWYTYYVRVKFSKWFFKTYKINIKDVINVNLDIERN